MKHRKLKKSDYIHVEGKDYSHFIYIPKQAKPSAIKVSHELTPEQIRYDELILKARSEKNKTSETQANIMEASN